MSTCADDRGGALITAVRSRSICRINRFLLGNRLTNIGVVMADAASTGKSGKVVIENIGLMLSGDIDKPILDADTIVVNDGVIVAIGNASDCDTAQAAMTVDARHTCVCPGL